jgi:hypothetical protein
MSDLSGSLRGIGVPAILRLLAAARDGGCLGVHHGGWRAAVYLDHGRVTGAVLGADRGADALDAIVLAFSQGEFAFDAGPDTTDTTTGASLDAGADTGVPPGGPDADLVDVALDELLQRLGRLERTAAPLLALRADVPLLDAVPRPATSTSRRLPSVAPDLVAPAHEGIDDAVTLDPVALHLCAAADGRRTVAEVAAGHGLARTVKAVVALVQLGVLELAVPETTTPAAEGAPANEIDEIRSDQTPGSRGRTGARPGVAAPGGTPPEEASLDGGISSAHGGRGGHDGRGGVAALYAWLLPGDDLLHNWVRPVALAVTVLLLLALIRWYSG